MAGLDKILEQIHTEAVQSSNEILEAGTLERDAYLAEAKAQNEKLFAAESAKIASNKEQLLARGESAAALLRRKRLLEARQSIIAETLSQAKESLCNLPDAEYFANIEKMVARYQANKAGKIAFNAKDLSRMPARMNEVFANFNLSLDETPVAIDGGFILLYDQTQENCSFGALFSSEQDRLRDIVSSVMFE